MIYYNSTSQELKVAKVLLEKASRPEDPATRDTAAPRESAALSFQKGSWQKRAREGYRQGSSGAATVAAASREPRGINTHATYL